MITKPKYAIILVAAILAAFPLESSAGPRGRRLVPGSVGREFRSSIQDSRQEFWKSQKGTAVTPSEVKDFRQSTREEVKDFRQDFRQQAQSSSGSSSGQSGCRSSSSRPMPRPMMRPPFRPRFRCR